VRRARLAYADLSGVLAEGGDFSFADLAGSALTDANLAGARFTGAWCGISRRAAGCGGVVGGTAFLKATVPTQATFTLKAPA